MDFKKEQVKEQENLTNLTNDNYFAPEHKKKYMSTTTFKDFLECEVMGLARANGEFQKSSNALLFGGYIDAYFSNELADFTAKHPEMFTKQGTLKADFQSCDEVIKAIENAENEEGEKIMLKYLDGEKQVVMTGVIAGVPWKIKIDAYHPHKAIVDQKVMKDLQPVWVSKNGMNVKVDFVEAYRYDIQGASYQEIVRQVTGDKLPFILAVTTKEECPDNLLLKIDNEYLGMALQEIEVKAPRYWDILQGRVEPKGCGHCPACRKKKKITGVMSYKQLFKEREEM